LSCGPGNESRGAMGYNARNDEILDNVTRMRREWQAQSGALATVRGNPLWMYQARRTLLSFGHATWGRRWRSWL
ncbi:MAG: hypothetical protein WBM31_00085, partial [Pseudolabrys sp.]